MRRAAGQVTIPMVERWGEETRVGEKETFICCPGRHGALGLCRGPEWDVRYWLQDVIELDSLRVTRGEDRPLWGGRGQPGRVVGWCLLRAV